MGLSMSGLLSFLGSQEWGHRLLLSGSHQILPRYMVEGVAVGTHCWVAGGDTCSLQFAGTHLLV